MSDLWEHLLLEGLVLRVVGPGARHVSASEGNDVDQGDDCHRPKDKAPVTPGAFLLVSCCGPRHTVSVSCENCGITARPGNHAPILIVSLRAPQMEIHSERLFKRRRGENSMQWSV